MSESPRHIQTARQTARQTAWQTLWPLVLLQAILLALTGMRLAATRASVLGQDPCPACQAWTVVQHDAALWALAWGLLLLATLRPRLLRHLGVAGLFLLLALLATDVLVLRHFGLRLYLADLLTYGQQPRFVVDYLRQLPPAQWLLLLATAIALPWALLRASARLLNQTRARAALALLALASLALHLAPDRIATPLPWTYQNLLEANRLSGADVPFSDDYLQSLTAEPPAEALARQCGPGLDRGYDVIVVTVESWSWYHSSLLLDDGLGATPSLDAYAREHAWWSRFLAQGFTTDHGLIALLAGQLPVPAVNRYRSFDVYSGYDGDWRSLPRRLGADGYHTAFLTSGHLGFLAKNRWLDTLGFDHIEGHDHPFYEGQERYHFAAVSDDLLFRRVLEWWRKERPAGQPTAAFVETVTTHPPFVDPRSGRPDEAGAFRFVDAQFRRFVEELAADGFFDRGLVVVTSDQRALTPLRRSERDAFGAEAGGRLPLVVIGDGIKPSGEVAGAAQMLDLPYSLDYLLTAEACRAPGQGNLFTGEAPDCIYQADGNRRSIVHAYCGTHHAEILMDGDRTRVTSGHLPEADRRLRWLNYQRARLGVQEANARNVL